MRSLTAATLIALSAVTLSCTKTQIEPETPKGPAIEFSTKDPWTKATNGTDEVAKDAMRKSGFNVWGWFRGTTNGHIFDAAGTKVHDATYNSDTESFSDTNPNWTYAPENPRYWMNGLYDFAAVYPFDTPDVTFNPQTDENGNTLLDGKPVLIIQDFDSSTQKDLLVALNSGPDGNGINGGEPQGPVALNFKHALTKIDFKIYQNLEIDNTNTYHITKFTLMNVNSTGSYVATYMGNSIISQWNALKNITYQYEKTFSVPVTLSKNSNGFIPIWDDSTTADIREGLLLIPQEIAEGVNRIKIRIEFILENEAGERRALFVDKDIPVPASGAPEEWASGKFITYPVLLAADSDLKFATPTVEPWYPSQAGGTIVIK
jgi:hypothetical protein